MRPNLHSDGGAGVEFEEAQLALYILTGELEWSLRRPNLHSDGGAGVEFEEAQLALYTLTGELE